MSANVVEHFAAHDKIEVTGKRIFGQVKVHEVHIGEPSAAFSRPGECDLGDISSDKTTDARSELFCEVAFCAGQLQGSRNLGRWKQRESLRIFRLFIRVRILPWIGLCRKNGLEMVSAVNGCVYCLGSSSLRTPH